jgi:hypothetical protein
MHYLLVPKYHGSTRRKISLDFDCFSDAKFLAIIAGVGTFSPLHNNFVTNENLWTLYWLVEKK